MTKRPSIQTNEGAPDKHISITATVVLRPDSTYPLVISPYKIDLSQLGDKVIDQSPITFKNVSEQTLDIHLIAEEGDYFDLDLPKQIGPGQQVEGKVTLRASAGTMSFDKSFTIEATPPGNGNGAAARFTVPVKRTVRVANQAGATKVLPRGGH